MNALYDRHEQVVVSAEQADERWRVLKEALADTAARLDALAAFMDTDAHFSPAGGAGGGGGELATAVNIQLDGQNLVMNAQRDHARVANAVKMCEDAQHRVSANVDQFLLQGLQVVGWRAPGTPLLAPGETPRVDLSNPTLGAGANNVMDTSPMTDYVFVSPM